MGRMDAILAAVEPYTIHGTPYFRIRYATRDDPDRMVEGRLGAESMYRNPKPGDHIRIRMLLGVIDDVQRIDPGDAPGSTEAPQQEEH